jgi:hypothetical protein
MKKKNYYLKIPVGEDLGDCFLFLKNAMESVAKYKGHKSRKSYFSKEHNCSKREVKYITEREINPKAVDLPLSKFRSKDAYRMVMRINIDHFSKIIKPFIKDYIQTNPPQDDLKMLLNYIGEWDLNPRTYEQVFCHYVFNGFSIVESDETTANYINNRDDVKALYEALIKALSINQTEIRL